MALLVGRSLDFVNLHGGIDGEIGIANGGAGRCGLMASRSGEITAGTFDRVGIAVAFGAGHGKRMGGNKFVERSAMAIHGDVTALRLGNLQEIGSNARQADGLRRSRTFVRRRQSLQREVIDDQEKGRTDQQADKRAHERIVTRQVAHFKRSARQVALGNNVSYLPPESQALGLTFARPAVASWAGCIFNQFEGLLIIVGDLVRPWKKVEFGPGRDGQRGVFVLPGLVIAREHMQRTLGKRRLRSVVRIATFPRAALCAPLCGGVHCMFRGPVKL
jgi:hypothetical protein